MTSAMNAETARPGARASPRGMTLIELLVVMVIAAILASISIPAVIGMGRGYGLKHSVSSVFNHLSLARQWAITHKENVTFRYFTTSTNSYFEVGITNDSGAFRGISSPVTNAPGVFFGEDGELIFMSTGGLKLDGLAKTNPPIVITHGNLSKKIVVNEFTGGIVVKE